MTQEQGANRSPQRLGWFGELRRRHVFRVAGAYIVAAWALLQGADVLFGLLEVPDWSMRALAALLLAGFPAAIILAWFLQLTPQGVKIDDPAEDEPPESVSTRPIDTFILLGLAIVVALFAVERFWWRQQSPAGAPVPTVAVLPFANLSGDETQDYFSDGLSDELIGMLGRIPELRVIGRTSSFRFKNQQQDLRQIGSELGVTHVVDGSVRRSGDTVRITAELLSAEDGVQLWNQTFDRELDDLLRVQAEIGRAVVGTLKVELLGDSLATPATLPVADAYDRYLRGLRLRRAGLTELDEAEALFKEAIALDPKLAVAWDGLVSTYINQVSLGLRSRDEGIALAKDTIAHTLALDPELADAHYALGFVRMVFDRDFSGAQEAYRECLSREPNHSGANSGLGLLLAALGQHSQAQDRAQRAAKLDPLNLTSYHNVGFVSYLGGSFAESEAAFRRGMRLANGAYARGNSRLSMTLLATGRPQEALAMASQDPADLWRLASEALALDTLGQGGDLQLNQLIEEYPDRAATSIARIYALRGAADQAFEWLERAEQNSDPEIVWVKSDPLFESLRSHPRMESLLVRLGLSS